MRSILIAAFATALSTAALGCSAEGVDAADQAATASSMTHTDANGVTTTNVDLRTGDRTLYIDLSFKTEVFPASPATSDAWDLSFSRRAFAANTGAGGVLVAALKGANFDALTVAPASGYDNGAAIAWFDYNPVTHAVTPKDVTYVVRSVSGDYFKVKFLSYYDATSAPYFPTFKWAPIDPPVN